MTTSQILVEAHQYWCGSLASHTDFPDEKAKIWFERSDETDAHIAREFGPHLDAVAEADWPIETLDREAQIGLIVFLDQFPRNLFRDDGRAYAYDATARHFAKRLVAGGVERFRLVERSFLYLPFEHSEDRTDQDLSVELYSALLADVPADQIAIYQNYLDFAEKHRALIQRFGRFPHRNADLARESTAEELAFLRESGRGY